MQAWKTMIPCLILRMSLQAHPHVMGARMTLMALRPIMPHLMAGLGCCLGVLHFSDIV